MTYARPTSDSMMVASTTTTTLHNGNHPDGGAWAGSPDRTEHHQHNASDEEGGQATADERFDRLAHFERCFPRFGGKSTGVSELWDFHYSALETERVGCHAL